MQNPMFLTLATLLASGGVVSVGHALAGAGGPDLRMDFSIDIGADSEMSDPNADGDEVFDPGDVYWFRGPFLPGPTDGHLDDAAIFGFDIGPAPAFGSVVPVCIPGFPIGAYLEFFDLDGHDQIDYDLSEWIPPDFPLQQPILQFPSNCIFRPDHLAISWDDDRGPGWIACDVPVTAPSAFLGIDSYGVTPLQDEVVGVTLGGALLPAPVVGVYGIAHERGVHVNMSPDPNLSREDDDDVDSLDAVLGPDGCPYWYFTADHEGTGSHPLAGGALDPGDIYLVTAVGPSRVVDEVIHLGIPDSVDIDAFEFVWSTALDGGPDGPGAALGLTILFSVDDDDPLTPGDESGGLAPDMIYASYMTGFSFPALIQGLGEDIDALTAWQTMIPPTTPCPGDADGDGDVDFDDLNEVLANWAAAVPPGTSGDVTGDGLVDFNDLNTVLANWGRLCL